MNDKSLPDKRHEITVLQQFQFRRTGTFFPFGEYPTQCTHPGICLLRIRGLMKRKEHVAEISVKAGQRYQKPGVQTAADARITERACRMDQPDAQLNCRQIVTYGGQQIPAEFPTDMPFF